ncbi:uncharacterized protein ETH [Prorops nasuta]|uniref:uncharacterized protein ETH n=1 Tax=Prorops nasuta TaxID=863751 RepID=UPI0034CF0713
MQISKSTQPQRYIMNALLLAVLLLMVHTRFTLADEVPAFFLKIAKNVPRIGRSDSSFEDFFFKTSKNIPRIGRREGSSEATQSWEQFSKPSKRRVDYSPFNSEPWSWQHFPLAIEGPQELWRTLAGYSTETADEIDNKIWERQKRTGSLEERA